MKNHFTLRSIWIASLALLCAFSVQGQYTQLPECTSIVPYFELDLSGNPDSSYQTPVINRQVGCCGNSGPNDDYVSFYVTLHPDVAMFELIVADGYADPPGSGAAFYNIISGDMITSGSCGVDLPAGGPQCITGAGPHKITYRKAGNNDIVYIFRQIPKPIYPANQATRFGCTLPLPIYGLGNIAITATAKSANCTASLSTLNTYLSCLNCADPIFEPGANATYPYTVTYQVTGTPLAQACGVFPTSGSFTITVYDELNVSVTPNPAEFCEGGNVTLEATATGGDGNFSYIWINSVGDTIPTSPDNELVVSVEDNYTVIVNDGLVSSTCDGASVTVPVDEGQTPIIQPLADQTACESSPTVVLNGSVQFADPYWTGGLGTFSPSRSADTVTYTPTAGEIAGGSVTLTLTSINAGGDCLEQSQPVTIFYSTNMDIVETIGSIVCYGQTTTINASVNDGVGPYNFDWNTGDVDLAAVSSSISVSAGTYGLTVTDMYSCSHTEYFTVNQPTPIELILTSTDETVVGNDGTASVSVSGGGAPYTIVLTNAGNVIVGSAVGNTLNVTGLPDGIYTATVTDDNVCTVAASTVVNTFACSALEVAVSSTEVQCYGESNGSVTAVGSGGTLPIDYSYSWNTIPVQNTATATGLPAGTYTVTLTDNNTGCFDIASVTIFQPTELTNTMTQTDVTTEGGNDGTATANPQGGTNPYDYLWSNSQTTQTATGLIAGTYSVTVTDDNNCAITDDVLINQPPCNDFLLAVNTTALLCNGDANSTATLFIANGNAPFNIVWSTGATNTNVITGLDAGNYSVTVSDALCTTTKNFTITEPDPISLGLAPSNVTCYGGTNGSIDLTVSGGTYPNYYYSWVQNGKVIAETQDLFMIAPGTYTVTLEDENGCTVTQSIGITQLEELVLSAIDTDNPCFGQSLGAIDASISGGTLPYTYSWNGPSGFTASTQDLSGLSAGLYTLIVTDGNGCVSKPLDDYISQPALLTATASMTNEVSCNNENDGAAEVVALGGTTPYSYAWTGPLGFSSAVDSITGIITGNYSAIVTDAHMCTANASVTVTTVLDITDPTITCPAPVSVFTDAGLCTASGVNLGTPVTADNCLVASVTNDAPVAFPLGTTTVTWTVADGLGNTATCTQVVTVSDNQNPTITCPTNVTDVADPGVCTAAIGGVTLGTPTTADNCSVSTVVNNAPAIFNLGPNTVTWTVTDGSGNTATCNQTVTITDNQNPTITCPPLVAVTANPGACFATSVALGTPTTADNCSVANVTNNAPAVFPLGNTTVVWTVTDGSGNSVFCNQTVTVTDNQNPTISCPNNVSVFANALCVATGVALGTPTTSDNCSISSVTNNAPATFPLGLTTVTWTVTDGSGNAVSCTQTVTVTDNTVPTITCPAPVSVVANAGVCTATGVTLGTPTTADNCSVSSVTNNAPATFPLGTTTVIWTVTDGSGNTATCTQLVTVTDNQNPTITCPPLVAVFANAGACIAGPVSLGTPTTADNCTSVTVTNNAPSVYPLGSTTVIWTVTDGSGNSVSCNQTITVTDNQNPTISCPGNVSVFANVTCVATGVSLGTPNTADNCSVSTVTNNAPAIYPLGATTVTWTVTDGSGNTASCIQTVTVIDNTVPTITCPAPVSVVADAGVCTAAGVVLGTPTTADNCSVASVTNNAPATFPLGTTTVTWTVTDGSGNTATCAQTVTVTDTQNPIISGCPSDITVSNDNGDCGAIVSWTIPTFTDNCGAVMTGGTPASGSFFLVGTTTITYTVTDGSGNASTCTFDITVNDTELPAISCPAPIASCNPVVSFNLPTISDNCGISDLNQTAGLPSGSFPIGTTVNTYAVSDIHGNSSVCSFSVTIHPIPVISFDVTNVSCNGLGDGEIDATITIGSAPYTFNWTNGASTEDLTNLIPGTYSLTVIDDNGCTDNAATMISQPETLTLNAETENVNCFNGTDGSIDVTVTGGTSPFTYDWSNNATSQDLNGLSVGNYDLTLTDANGCEVLYSAIITQPDTLLLTPTIYDASCTSATGTIFLEVSGGTNPYDYQWSNGTTGFSLYNVVAGTYSVDVTDANGCMYSFTGTIGSVSALAGNLIPKDVKCYGDSTGEIEAVITNGYAPYTYEWSDGQSNGIASELSAGNYSVTITDFYGCEVTLTADVNQPDSLYIILSNSLYSGGNNISQYGGDDGYINSNVYGGVSPYDYSWFGPDNFTSEQQNIINLEQGAYLLTVTDANGCQASISSRLTQPDILEMPNGFSPNGDKDNENFVVHGIDAYPDNTIQIFNRWGNLVYEVDGYNNEWNGDNMNGEPLPDGTYFVVLIVRINGEDLDPLTGYVDLRR
jgi:gliding motility-associated-like protein